jgi:hypothetical protein
VEIKVHKESQLSWKLDGFSHTAVGHVVKLYCLPPLTISRQNHSGRCKVPLYELAALCLTLSSYCTNLWLWLITYDILFQGRDNTSQNHFMLFTQCVLHLVKLL